MKFARKPFDMNCLTLGMVLHYLGKLKIQTFCIYSAHMQENTDKLHLSAQILIPLCVQLCTLTVLMCFIKILFSLFNIMLIVDKHCCDEFPVPQIDC